MSDSDYMGAMAWLKALAMLFMVPALFIVLALLPYTPNQAALIFIVIALLSVPAMIFYWAFLSADEDVSLVNWARGLIASTIFLFLFSVFLFSTGGSVLRTIADKVSPPKDEVTIEEASIPIGTEEEQSALDATVGDSNLNLGFRNLVSKDGRKVRAHVIFVGDSQVEILREDGERFMMPLDHLSPSDAGMLKDLREKHQLGIK